MFATVFGLNLGCLRPKYSVHQRGLATSVVRLKGRALLRVVAPADIEDGGEHVGVAQLVAQFLQLHPVFVGLGRDRNAGHVGGDDLRVNYLPWPGLARLFLRFCSWDGFTLDNVFYQG